MNVIGYVRVSTSGQARDGYSLGYQQDEIRSYCERQGWNLLQVFTDEGISGAKVDEDALEVDRIGFQSMLAAIASQDVDAVVVLNTSRLWRSDIVKVLVHREFKKYGVDVNSIEQPTYSIYKKDPSDFLINGLMELLDAYQRLEISMKLSRGRTDFDIKVNDKSLPYWVMEDEVKSNLTRLSINSKYFNDFSKLIDFLIEQSPEKTILFRTRYQGGDKEIICGVISLEEFWKLYSQSRLLFNTCYIVRKV